MMINAAVSRAVRDERMSPRDRANSIDSADVELARERRPAGRVELIDVQRAVGCADRQIAAFARILNVKKPKNPPANTRARATRRPTFTDET